MLKKQAGNPQIDRLRVIQLLEADMNLAFRILWGRKVIHNALNHNIASPWQFGSKPGESVQSVLLLKVLSHDYLRLTRTNAAVFNNDARACYDCIIPSLGLAATERFGIPALASHAC